jgi:hypothetical protein
MYGPLSFAAIMLGLGAVASLFPQVIRTASLRLTRGKGEFLLGPGRTIRSIRLGGLIGILIGVFMLWAVWRSR